VKKREQLEARAAHAFARRERTRIWKAKFKTSGLHFRRCQLFLRAVVREFPLLSSAIDILFKLSSAIDILFKHITTTLDDDSSSRVAPTPRHSCSILSQSINILFNNSILPLGVSG